jgi:hypothetical protein
MDSYIDHAFSLTAVVDFVIGAGTVFLLALLFGASELSVDGLFSHRFNVNFLTSVGVYSKQGIDVIVPLTLS